MQVLASPCRVSSPLVDLLLVQLVEPVSSRDGSVAGDLEVGDVDIFGLSTKVEDLLDCVFDGVFVGFVKRPGRRPVTDVEAHDGRNGMYRDGGELASSC